MLSDTEGQRHKSGTTTNGEYSTRTKSTASSLATKHTRYTTRILFLNLVTFSLILAYLVIFIVKTVESCRSNNWLNGVPILSDLFTWLFSILGVIFLITGLLMIFSIKRFYPAFYEDYGKLIWIATICLTLPLFVRGLNSNLYGKQKRYWEWYGNHFAAVNTMYVLLSSILPVVT